MATIRFYIDADILGLADVLVRLRGDVTFPGDPGGVGPDKKYRPACPVPSPAVHDPDWIPVVADLGWLIITKDLGIARKTRERHLVKETGARMVAVASPPGEKLRTWGQLEIVMANWRRIEALEGVPGPFIYRASRSGLSSIAL